jgi:hypothetical protein
MWQAVTIASFDSCSACRSSMLATGAPAMSVSLDRYPL